MLLVMICLVFLFIVMELVKCLCMELCRSREVCLMRLFLVLCWMMMVCRCRLLFLFVCVMRMCVSSWLMCLKL